MSFKSCNFRSNSFKVSKHTPHSCRRKTKYCNDIYSTPKSRVLFSTNRWCYFGGEKAPAGAHPVAPSLESTCFMHLRHKTTDSLCIKYRRCILGGEKAPAGAHPDAPSLESTYFVYLRHKNTHSLLIEYRR